MVSGLSDGTEMWAPFGGENCWKVRTTKDESHWSDFNHWVKIRRTKLERGIEWHWIGCYHGRVDSNVLIPSKYIWENGQLIGGTSF